MLINISVTGEDGEREAEIANAVAEQFTRTVADLEQSDGEGVSPVKASLIRPARAATVPVSPNPSRNLALGLSLGLMLGVAAAVLREMLDTRITGASDVQRVSDRPVIGGITFDRNAPRNPLMVQDGDYSPRAEAFRAVRTNLQFIDAAEQPRALLFTSSLPGEGKSTTAANLALTLAASGASVCVVEADLRRPKLLEYMSLDGTAGLTSVLIGQASLDDVLQPYGDHLTALGAGAIPPNPSELLGGPAMRALMDDLRSRFEYVVVDAPPLLPVTDAAVLSKVVDGTIVVVGSGIVRRHQLAQSLATLNSVDAKVLGVLLNRLPSSGASTYGYYHEYGPSAATDPPRHGRRERAAPGREARWWNRPRRTVETVGDQAP
ncbi:polysaccharide biosynthesis tyrosine autokinase [Ornithinimicrobium sp. W1665]|uniref:polysaccharide biosynthesis tyrosine autokinase n=1 Tax=Ornithinimicrobium sp. W1665 TaxID=3416666 RepID=UPI003D6A8785